MGRNAPLSGRVVLLTGADGPAEAMTRRLLSQGARVALAGAVAASAGLATAPGSRVLALPCNLDSPAETGRVVDTVIDRFGRLDHLVNLVATRTCPVPLMELDPLSLSHTLQRDLVMPLAWTQRAYWRWMTAHGGSVVNVVANAVRDHPQDTVLAGLTELTEWLAAELTPQVDVHTLVPNPAFATAAYQAGITDVLPDVLTRRGNRIRGPVLVLTEECVDPPRAA